LLVKAHNDDIRYIFTYRYIQTKGDGPLVDILFHADDLGIDEDQSRRILACSTVCGGKGILNSVSILANSPRFEACADLLEPYLDCLHVGVHLNVVEGHCCADPTRIPLLVDERGCFKRGFAGLLLASLGPHRSALAAQLRVEIAAQLERVVARFPPLRQALRVDSHQHFHLIPLMFDALLAVVEEGAYHLVYLRVPAEPLTPFLDRRVFFTLRPVNWVKHVVLNALWRFDRRRFPASCGQPAVFCGILLSGCMDAARLSVLAPAFEAYAARRGAALEFLFHPGALTDAQTCLDPHLSGFIDFYLSEGRGIEAAALESLR
jgi:chitin disaccharide deacetylase